MHIKFVSFPQQVSYVGNELVQSIVLQRHTVSGPQRHQAHRESRTSDQEQQRIKNSRVSSKKS
jgi:hypothetical protein